MNKYLKEVVKGFAVIDCDATENPIVAIMPTRVDAQELIYTICEEEAYETYCTANFFDLGLFFGNDKNFQRDMWYLIKEASKSFKIQECPTIIYERKLI